jgi:hypothetical protein
MDRDFLRGPLGKLGSPVCRIGLSATYRPGRATVHKAPDEGLNYFVFFGIDSHMTSVLRELVPARRDQYVLATGAYNYIFAHENCAARSKSACGRPARITSTSSISSV